MENSTHWQKGHWMCLRFITMRILASILICSKCFWKLGLKCFTVTELCQPFCMLGFVYWSNRGFFLTVSQHICVPMIFSPSKGQEVSYIIPSRITQLVSGRHVTLLPSHSYLCPLSWPLMHPSGLLQVPGSAICCLLVLTSKTHKVLISTLYWITVASLHDWTQPFHCLVPLSTGEYFTSLELVIGFPPGSLLPFSAVKDPRVWFSLHLTECFRVGFVTWRQVKSWQQCIMDLMAVRYM